MLSINLMKLKSSSLATEGALKVSQPLKIPLFLDGDEMESFLYFLESHFTTLSFYDTHSVVTQETGIYKSSSFLNSYKEYISFLQRGELPLRTMYHGFFSMALSITSDIFYQIDLEDEKRIIKATRPHIQLQPHHMTFSEDTHSLYSMTYSEDSITFGIQLSYPHFFQDPHSHEVLEVDSRDFFPNTQLFNKIRHWIREHTLPTPFLIQGKKVNFPIRLGKNCFPWINRHPQLQSNQLYVNRRNP